jgi:hypothetical protein
MHVEPTAVGAGLVFEPDAVAAACDGIVSLDPDRFEIRLEFEGGAADDVSQTGVFREARMVSANT